jgi:hypothetical protein
MYHQVKKNTISDRPQMETRTYSIRIDQLKNFLVV